MIRKCLIYILYLSIYWGDTKFLGWKDSQVDKVLQSPDPQTTWITGHWKNCQYAIWITRLQYGSKLYTLFILYGHYGEVRPWTQEVYASARLGTYELAPDLSFLLTHGSSEPPHQICSKSLKEKRAWTQKQPINHVFNYNQTCLLAFVESFEMFRTYMFTDYMPIHGTYVLL